MKSIYIDTGPYTFKLVSSCESLQNAVKKMYGESQVKSLSYDFDIAVRAPNALRSYIAPQINFYCDTYTPFFPLPKKQSYPMLEWGMNWCIAAHEYSRLVIHAAVLEKNGKAIVCPALPGAGKSTLSALLSEMGWSIFSDEMAIIELDSLNVKSIYRPICLKNDAIDLVKNRFPNSVFTEKFYDTQKGTVAHKRVHSVDSYKDCKDTQITVFVFPQFSPNAETELSQYSSAEGVLQVIRNSFNYHVLAEKGFEAMADLAEKTKFYSLKYSDIESAEQALAELIS
ncbi:HprK-related kinase A [Alteromonas macleodii]